MSLQYMNPASIKNKQYLNWDNASDKSLILKDQIPLNEDVIILDEIHKYKKWRNLIKGIYDKFHEDHKIIVTGSARLDYFRKGGDSLLGRYRYFKLHPFSISEYKKNPTLADLVRLMKFGGFPEPLFSMNALHRRYRRSHNGNSLFA